MKIKTFYSYDGLTPLEEEINQWLDKSGEIKVISTKYQYNGRSHVYIILYKQKQHGWHETGLR